MRLKPIRRNALFRNPNKRELSTGGSILRNEGVSITPEYAADRLLDGRNRWLDLRLRQEHHLLVLTAKFHKHAGLSQATHDKWTGQFIKYVNTQDLMTRQAKVFIAGMIDYFNDHATAYATGRKLLCCSDVIESLFGRYKNKGGMKAISAYALSIALYNQRINTEFIRTECGG